MQAPAYLVPLWLSLSLLQCFVLGINEVNHLNTAICTIDEKKKTLNTLTFICSISLSTGLLFTKSVLFVECFLLVLDVSLIASLSYFFISVSNPNSYP